jgi:hypothetical protein
MVTGWQILSSGILSSAQGENIGEKNKGYPNILGVAAANQKLPIRAP